ncbi:hypothetical protein [Halobacillus kuroshimensis]|uniref:hypothetical protein n=1 Tax=Halobacillus kuroshimensis TaxID=302481 RepID=UPI00055116C0|nr:hypothetical protein [Halobacillus kuroshimensis]
MSLGESCIFIRVLAAFLAAISLSIIWNIISTGYDYSVMVFGFTFPLFLIGGTLADKIITSVQKSFPIRPPLRLFIWILAGGAVGCMLDVFFVKSEEVLLLSGWGAGSALLYAVVLKMIRFLSLLMNEKEGNYEDSRM